ncbi:MAG TPA: hypothetical protein VGK29_15010 [Paludibaculum sp.]|jgi:hypothetical protein
MPKHLILILLLGAAVLPAQAPPQGIKTSTWVREDLFAGFMANDMERFARGMKKLDAILESNPQAIDAVCWKGGAELWLAARAHEAGRTAEFDPLYAKAIGILGECRKAAEGTPYLEAAHAISGGVWVVVADRLPAHLRREAWTNVKANYTALQADQKNSFEKLPSHMKGEVLAGLAQAAQRLGEQQELQGRLRDVVEQLPGSVYASRAKRWQEDPAVATSTSITCQTCHDAGRLEAVLKSSRQ